MTKISVFELMMTGLSGVCRFVVFLLLQTDRRTDGPAEGVPPVDRLHTRIHGQTREELTATTTVSSPLNFGMYLSPRLRSASFSGLKRHITFTPHTPHSAASTITDTVR